MIAISVPGTVPGPAQGKQTWSLLSGSCSLQGPVRCPRISEPTARHNDNSAPGQRREGSGSSSSDQVLSELCLARAATATAPSVGRPSLTHLSGAGDCFETLRQKQFMGPPFRKSSSENAKSVAGLEHLFYHTEEFPFGCPILEIGTSSRAFA